jgi:hypothetical protein
MLKSRILKPAIAALSVPLGIALLALLIPAGAVAGTQHTSQTPMRDSLLTRDRASAAASLSCANDTTYPTPMYLANIYHVIHGGTLATSWSSPQSPYPLYIQDEYTPTAYCFYQNGSGYYTLQQYGTQRCLYLETSNRTITEGNCASNYALWEINYYAYDGVNAWTIESHYQSSGDPCIYQAALNDEATYDPCSDSATGDLWQFDDAS